MATVTEELHGTEQTLDSLTAGAFPADGPTPPATGTLRSSMDRDTGLDQRPPWLHTNLRNLIALTLTGFVCYLTFRGNENAMAALIAAFSVLMGALWGERAALKVPGKDA